MNLAPNGYPFLGNIRNSNPRAQTVNGPLRGFTPRPTRQVNPTRPSNNSTTINEGISNIELLDSMQEFQKSIKECVENIQKDVADLKQQIDTQRGFTMESGDTSSNPNLSNQEMLYYQNALQQANYTVASIAQSAIASMQKGNDNGQESYAYPGYYNSYPNSTLGHTAYNWAPSYPAQNSTDCSKTIESDSHSIQQAYQQQQHQQQQQQQQQHQQQNLSVTQNHTQQTAPQIAQGSLFQQSPQPASQPLHPQQQHQQHHQQHQQLTYSEGNEVGHTSPENSSMPTIEAILEQSKILANAQADENTPGY